MLATDSHIYKYLKGLENWVNNYRDSYDIYFLILGYYNSLILLETNFDEEKKWITDFLFFVREELMDRFESKNLGGHIGHMVLTVVDGDRVASIELFYKLLDDYVDRYVMEYKNGKLISNIERHP